MLRMMIPHLHGWFSAMAAHAKLFAIAFGLPILPGESIKADYTGLCEPTYPNPVQGVNQYTDSGAVAFNASPVVVTVTIAPNPDGSQPIVRKGKWRVRVSGVTAGTTIGAGSVTVSDGGAHPPCRVGGTGAALVGQSVDQQGDIAAIDNALNFGSANDGMPILIKSISLSLAFTTTDGSGNSIGSVTLEFFGGP
jgi:hypothetical protein